MQTITVNHSPDLKTACRAFRTDVLQWARECRQQYADSTATDVHDQATFMAGWSAILNPGIDGDLIEFMKATRDRIREHFTDSDAWCHGYWRVHEPHHGTEHFEIFLGELWKLDPGDQVTPAHLCDAAEHTGNWVSDIPPWFDWDTGLFRAVHLGTAEVRQGVGENINLPDHLRFVNVALLAWHMTTNHRYLDLATRHAGVWADAIAAGPAIPSALTPQGHVVRLDSAEATAYHAFAGMAPQLVTNLDRAENLFASRAVETFLELWSLTHQTRFRVAADTILAELVTQLADPDAGCLAQTLRVYRQTTQDTRFDENVLAATREKHAQTVSQVALRVGESRRGRESGLGKRGDKPEWLDDEHLRTMNPMTLALAAEIRGDHTMATGAVDLAHACFQLARTTFPDGRDHGCSARTVNAIARGHGRENGAGMVTAVLVPAIHMATETHT